MMTNETETNEDMLSNITFSEEYEMNHSAECGILNWNEDYQIISSTVQVRIVGYIILIVISSIQ